jgi:hypothetical protein
MGERVFTLLGFSFLRVSMPQTDIDSQIMEEAQEIFTNLKDKIWRMCSGKIYRVMDKSGNIVPFIPNLFQRFYFETKHTRNLFLKGRQIGISTAVQLDYFDDMLFGGKNLMC